MDSEIQAFYNNSNVLITGGTGLLGQLLVEKLLRTCSNIKGIYLILREKKQKSTNDRISAVFEDPLFNKLRGENPDFTKKIHIVQGDCSQLKLGLDEASRELLVDKIDIVLHCAAYMSFEAKLIDVVHTNIRGLYELLDLCRQMKNIKSMVFVSTAYANSIDGVTEERFYNTPLEPDTIVKLVDESESEVLENIAPNLIGHRHNTYLYSKAIAEEVIRKHAGNFPVCIFRPSIVMPTHSDPVPGWTCNVYGPLGLIIVVGLGILRVTHGDPDVKLDLVPADLCINALLCTAWETHLKL